MANKRAFIIHGWDGSPDEGWFPWLKIELEKNGFTVTVPSMPNPSEPIIDVWVSYLSEAVGDVDENTHFIGHSIGCQTILRYLERLNTNQKAGSVTFVAGWFTLMNLQTDEENTIAKPWLETPIDCEKIKHHAKAVFAIFSDNDPVVPITNEILFAERLGAKTAIVHGLGHLGGNDGVTAVPEALDALLEQSHETID